MSRIKLGLAAIAKTTGGVPGQKNKFSSYDRSRGDLADVEDRIKKYCS